MNLTQKHKLFVEVLNRYIYQGFNEKRHWMDSASGQARFRRDVKHWLTSNMPELTPEEREATAKEEHHYAMRSVREQLKGTHILQR